MKNMTHIILYAILIMSLGCKDNTDINPPKEETDIDTDNNNDKDDAIEEDEYISGSVEVKNNFEINSITDAGFYDYSQMDLRTDNPEILKIIPNLNDFYPKIGLYKDEFRKEVVSREESGGLTDRIGEGGDNEDQEIFP